MKPYHLTLVVVMLFACNGSTDIKPAADPDRTLAVDRQYRPLLHHFSSTGCGPCGRFGLPVHAAVAEQMADSIVPLITHFKYNDPFITASSKAIENALLDQWYSPQLWVNDQDVTYEVIFDDIEDAVQKMLFKMREVVKPQAEAYVGLDYTLNAASRYDMTLAVENGSDRTQTFFVEIYAMEDSVVASQAGADPFVATHYKVNRGGYYGGMGRSLELSPGEHWQEELEFIPCWVCDAKAQYFYVIVWKEVSEGRFSYVNGKVLKH